MGDASSALRAYADTVKATAMQRAQTAVNSAAHSAGSRLTGFLFGSGSSAAGGGAPGRGPGRSLLPWVLGAVAVAGVGYVAMRGRR
jgi:hypothetical protein